MFQCEIKNKSVYIADATHWGTAVHLGAIFYEIWPSFLLIASEVVPLSHKIVAELRSIKQGRGRKLLFSPSCFGLCFSLNEIKKRVAKEGHVTVTSNS